MRATAKAAMLKGRLKDKLKYFDQIAFPTANIRILASKSLYIVLISLKLK